MLYRVKVYYNQDHYEKPDEIFVEINSTDPKEIMGQLLRKSGEISDIDNLTDSSFYGKAEDVMYDYKVEPIKILKLNMEKKALTEE